MDYFLQRTTPQLIAKTATSVEARNFCERSALEEKLGQSAGARQDSIQLQILTPPKQHPSPGGAREFCHWISWRLVMF